MDALFIGKTPIDLTFMNELPALAVPSEKIIDTNGAGDVFHGADVFSCLENPGKP